MFSHLPKDEQRTRLLSLLQSLTGTHTPVVTLGITPGVTLGTDNTRWTNERLDKILSAMERFQSFVDSGGQFSPISQTAIPHALVFESFVFDRGGALLTNELWAILLFLAWWEQQQTLFSREETLLLSVLKQEAKQSPSPFKPSERFTQTYKQLLAHWRGSLPNTPKGTHE